MEPWNSVSGLGEYETQVAAHIILPNEAADHCGIESRGCKYCLEARKRSHQVFLSDFSRAAKVLLFQVDFSVFVEVSFDLAQQIAEVLVVEVLRNAAHYNNVVFVVLGDDFVELASITFISVGDKCWVPLLNAFQVRAISVKHVDGRYEIFDFQCLTSSATTKLQCSTDTLQVLLEGFDEVPQVVSALVDAVIWCVDVHFYFGVWRIFLYFGIWLVDVLRSALSGLLKGPFAIGVFSFFDSGYHIDYNFQLMFTLKAN